MPKQPECPRCNYDGFMYRPYPEEVDLWECSECGHEFYWIEGE